MGRRFADLVRIYAAEGHSPEIVEVSLAEVLAAGDDPLSLITYLGSLGIVVRSVSDLLRVNALHEEEELSAHTVLEGIAISIASEGSWVLFRP